MYKDRIKQYYFATVSEGEKYFQLKIQSILSNIKTHTLTWKSVSVKKKTMAREHSFQKQSKFQHQWAMWLTGCAVVLIVGIRPNKPIQWKKSFVFVTDDSFHRSITMHFRIDWFFSWKKWTLFGAWKNRICSFTSHDATFLFSLLIVMSKSTTTILYFVHMRWAIHVKKQLILSPSSFSSLLFPQSSTFFKILHRGEGVFLCFKTGYNLYLCQHESFSKHFCIFVQ